MVTQADIARVLDVSPMAISRAAKSIGGLAAPLSERCVLLLLTAGELRRMGLAWHIATELVGKFDGDIHALARWPERVTWLVFVERNELPSFQTACISRGHLCSILAAHPLSLVLDLREPVDRALDLLTKLRGVAC